MQLLFYEGDEHSDDGPCLCYSKRDSRAKNKAIVPFLLWTMPSRIVCKTGLSSPITNLSNGNLECAQNTGCSNKFITRLTVQVN